MSRGANGAKRVRRGGGGAPRTDEEPEDQVDKSDLKRKRDDFLSDSEIKKQKKYKKSKKDKKLKKDKRDAIDSPVRDLQTRMCAN